MDVLEKCKSHLIVSVDQEKDEQDQLERDVEIEDTAIVDDEVLRT